MGIDLPASLIERRIRGDAIYENPYTFGNQSVDRRNFADIPNYGRGMEFYAGLVSGLMIPFGFVVFGLDDIYRIKKGEYKKQAILQR